MPLYEYKCSTCNHRFERIQKVSDPPPAKRPHVTGERFKCATLGGFS